MFKRIVEAEEEMFMNPEGARRWAQTVIKKTARYRGLIKLVQGLDKEGRYLDVGAGTGNVAAMIAQKQPAVRITALEISPLMVDLGREYVEKKGLRDRIEFIQGNAEDETILASLGTFDVIYSTFTFHHFANPTATLQSFYELLNKNGVCIIYDLKRVWWLYWVPIKNGFFKSIRGSFTIPEIQGKMGELALTTYKVRSVLPFFLYSLIIQKP
jgi:ubiquinone/menaquinone biosynthesis C-methylase UbiE